MGRCGNNNNDDVIANNGNGKTTRMTMTAKIAINHCDGNGMEDCAMEGNGSGGNGSGGGQ